jgi:VIT1/CCC1 family predicted Fe2+/Mn2+ transporter
MNKSLVLLAVFPALALAACSATEPDGAQEPVSADAESGASDVAEASSAADAAESAVPDLAPIAQTTPQLAYAYDFAFRLAGDAIGGLQRRHADLCEQQGPASCQILGMTKSGEDADDMTGELRLAVATRHTRAFGALLEKEAESVDAVQLSSEIATEELSKQMVDTEAHLRARTELRDRLLEVLRTRRGSVEELVAAERSVAEVNQEIDTARSWLKEMQGRVAYSTVTVRYESGAPVANDFLRPVQGALGALGGILGFVVAALILLGAVLGPVAGLVWLGKRINRKAEVA